MAKAMRVHRLGGPDVLSWEDVDVPAPGPGQVLIRHTAIGVNFRDVYLRTGLHAASLPMTPGLEGAGTVEAVGPGVAEFAPGQRVAVGAGPDGAYAEFRLMAADKVVALPDAIDDRTAAAVMVKGMTARYLVKETYAVKPGDTILVHAAAGGVGQILCQWAKAIGATVIGTVGSDAKVAVARDHGCHHVVVYTKDDFVARVREITGGKGCAAVYDSVGKATFEGSLQCLRPLGVLAQFGEASGNPEPIDPRRLGPLGSIYVTHPSLNWYVPTREALLANVRDVFDALATGKVRLAPSRTFALKDAAEAHRALESRQTTGTLVLIP